MQIVIGSDHRGFRLKEALKKHVSAKNIKVIDVGAPHFNKDDDYTLYAEKVAVLVSKNPTMHGILICGSGVGVDIAANKFDGIRASIGFTSDQVKAGRAHDNMNVLVLAADFLSEPQAKILVDSFLSTDFDNIERHKRRLTDIEHIEENN